MSTILQKKAEQFYEIFKGMENAHGTYNLANATEKDSKKIVGAAAVIHEPPTATTWKYHLLGQQFPYMQQKQNLFRRFLKVLNHLKVLLFQKVQKQKVQNLQKAHKNKKNLAF